MSSISLVPDLNEKIICENITEYPTFRRFLLTIHNRDERIGYIRKYLSKFVSDHYLMRCSIKYEDYDHNNYKKVISMVKYKNPVHTLMVINYAVEIPFFEEIDSLSFVFGLSNLKNTRSYAHIESIEVRGKVTVSPWQFVHAFPKLRKFKCNNTNFIEGVLAIKNKIEIVDFTFYYGLQKRIPSMYPNVEFLSRYDSVGYMEMMDKSLVKNLKCTLKDGVKSICEFDPANFVVEGLYIYVNAKLTSPLVIPQRYKDLRFLTIACTYEHCPNVDIVIDGFPLLESIEIYTSWPGHATCRIANVPYILFFEVDLEFDLDIDYNTVSILEKKN